MTFRPAAPRLPALVIAFALAAIAPAGRAETESDAERARRAAQEQRIVPLASILDWIEARYRGHAIEVELDDDEGEPPTYEVEWMTPAGHVVEFEFDATNGALLETEGRGIEDARR